MSDYESIRKDLYERFHVAFEKLYMSELKDQIAYKDEIITAQDHMIGDQQDKVKRLEAALRELLEADDNLRELMPRRVSEALIEGALIRVRTAKDKARAALGKSK